MFSDSQIYKFIRISVFLLMTYIFLIYAPSKTLDNFDILKLLVLMAVLFIIIDTYYPNIYYD